MGLMARSMGECNVPPIGNPCDLKFMECCTGITDESSEENGGYNATGTSTGMTFLLCSGIPDK